MKYGFFIKVWLRSPGDEGLFVASCLDADVTSVGATPIEALLGVGESIDYAASNSTKEDFPFGLDTCDPQLLSESQGVKENGVKCLEDVLRAEESVESAYVELKREEWKWSVGSVVAHLRPSSSPMRP